MSVSVQHLVSDNNEASVSVKPFSLLLPALSYSHPLTGTESRTCTFVYVFLFCRLLKFPGDLELGGMG